MKHFNLWFGSVSVMVLYNAKVTSGSISTTMQVKLFNCESEFLWLLPGIGSNKTHQFSVIVIGLLLLQVANTP